MSSKFSNIFLISVLILGLIFSPLALTEFTFAQEQGKPEGVGKPEDKTKPEGVGKPEDKAAKLADKLQRKESKLAQPIEDRQAKGLQKSKEIKEQLLQKIDQLKPNQKGLLKKVESGEYIGPILDGDLYTNKYVLEFSYEGTETSKVMTTAIGNSDETDTIEGHITMKNVVTRSNNLKLEVTDCLLFVDLVEYYCAFGKARQTSSGPGGDKYSMVIIAFLEDDSGSHNTLKISLSADTSLGELDSGYIPVTIKSPQSKISHKWFIGGDATLEITSFSGLNTEIPLVIGEEEPEVEVPEVEEPEVEVPEVEEPEVEVLEVEEP